MCCISFPYYQWPHQKWSAHGARATHTQGANLGGHTQISWSRVSAGCHQPSLSFLLGNACQGHPSSDCRALKNPVTTSRQSFQCLAQGMQYGKSHLNVGYQTTVWPHRSGTLTGQRHPQGANSGNSILKVPDQKSHTGCHQPSLHPLLDNTCQASPVQLPFADQVAQSIASQEV